DGSAEAARCLGADVVRLERQRGFAAAVNAGLQRCRREWVALLNNDVDLEPDWLERVLAAARSASAWFACGKLLDAGRPGRLDGAFDLVCRGATAWRAGSGRPDGPVWDEPRPVRFAGFAAVLLRRELFQIAGPLDECFGSYLEDVEFCLRCALRDMGGIYVPQARGRHTGSATLGRWSPAAVRLIARNQLLLVARHYPADWRRRYGRPVLAAQLLWGAVACRHGALAAWARGKQEGWKMFRSLRALSSPAPPDHLAALLAACENEIARLQALAGRDPYWTLYFALAGKPPLARA
ncbi:MAG: glycosyltransferase family 2 protein, partial [Bryobacteraceae bacterium]